jgi:hypothetical protein
MQRPVQSEAAPQSEQYELSLEIQDTAHSPRIFFWFLVVSVENEDWVSLPTPLSVRMVASVVTCIMRGKRCPFFHSRPFERRFEIHTFSAQSIDLDELRTMTCKLVTENWSLGIDDRPGDLGLIGSRAGVHDSSTLVSLGRISTVE